ncbi:MAG: phage portal protein [Ghiorsea sp.]
MHKNNRNIEYIEPHGELEENKGRYKYFRHSYEGGAEYREGRYLIQHENERKSSYDRRVKQSMFVNLCAPVVDAYTAHLFRQKAKRKYEALGEVPWFSDFLENTDYDGRDYPRLMREIARQAGVLGHVGVIVDMPQSEGIESMQQQMDAGIHPYVSVYSPENIINWKHTRINGVPSLEWVCLKEESFLKDTEVFKVWFAGRWEEYHVPENGKGFLAAEGTHPMPKPPFVLFKNRDSAERMGGVSDIRDIADINKRIYYYDSDALEIIERTAFPFLEVPTDPMNTSDEGDIVVGTSNVLERDIADGVGHRFIEPNHSSLTRIMEWRSRAIADIAFIAKTGAVEVQGSRVESGISLEIRFQQLNALLSDKASNMEYGEKQILSLVAAWAGVVFDGAIEYPTKFGLRDLSSDLDNIIRTQAMINSESLNKMVQKDLAAQVMSSMETSREDTATVEEEIDTAEPVGMPMNLPTTGMPEPQTTPVLRKPHRQEPVNKPMAGSDKPTGGGYDTQTP